MQSFSYGTGHSRSLGNMGGRNFPEYFQKNTKCGNILLPTHEALTVWLNELFFYLVVNGVNLSLQLADRRLLNSVIIKSEEQLLEEVSSI